MSSSRPFYHSQGNPDWEEWERDVAYAIESGDQVKGSGRFDMAKGDVKTHSFLIDCKYTNGSGYALTEALWDKLGAWATNEYREPVVAVRIENESAIDEVAVIPEHIYYQIVKEPLRIDDSGLKRQKSRKIGASMSSKRPTIFQLGRQRLVAYRFSEFAEDANRYEKKLEGGGE